ncbi:hypothetical protein HNR44_002170 [Geomicrobium halophilum]|uniref:Uncharacterized protein n=1 Tax=Geomicrobium halophilum TaxID=549000 RepID=A0A841PMW2_9BACL|nr:hypothetical protein [Geomicrobium halophilum]MBB6450187.1 hypothetical protein [Geomicrobium halophilum]
MSLLKIAGVVLLSITVPLLAFPSDIVQAESSTTVLEPQSIHADVFDNEDDLIETIKGIQSWTHHLLSDKGWGDVDSTTGAKIVEDLHAYYTKDLALDIYNQFYRPHLVEYEDYSDWLEVDSLMYRDIDHLDIDVKEDYVEVIMDTSSVEDGAGNRAHFEEIFSFVYDSERDVYLIAKMNSKQTY